MREEEVGTYQMLWDCAACGTSGLLGLEHKHCPNCGSAQDPKLRYFPPEGSEVSAENHPYHGADVACPACDTPNSAQAKHCISCGSPLGEGKAVMQRSEQATEFGQSEFETDNAKKAKQDFKAQKRAAKEGPSAPPPPKGMSIGAKVGMVVGVVVLLLVGLIMLFSWSEDAPVKVQGHAWQRTIDIEQKKRVMQTAWQDQVPRQAFGVQCKQEKRSTKKVKDGETCRTVRKDKGNGTFKKVKECKPKYRQEPVYDKRCRFEVERWTRIRTEKAEGLGITPAPGWPKVRLARRGSCLGCERQGRQKETYEVIFLNLKTQETLKCEMPMSKWTRISVGSEWVAKVGVVSKSVSCDNLSPRP